MKAHLVCLALLTSTAFAAPARECRALFTAPAGAGTAVSLSSPRGSKLATLFAQLQTNPKNSAEQKTTLESIFESLKGPVFRADMREVDGIAIRYREVIEEMNQEVGADVIRALYSSQPILREYVEEAQGVAVIDEANPPLYMRINRMLKKYKDEADPLASIKRDDPVAAEKIAALDRALAVLPRVAGIVFRGGAVSKEDAKRMQSGEMSRHNVAPFWSTSSNSKMPRVCHAFRRCGAREDRFRYSDTEWKTADTDA
ncbi:MAG: hypothetical protein IPJ84_02550 [Bdellovibrionales bacterium]|nr:hypothetical protein [Bdellovibrionales bacterium]